MPRPAKKKSWEKKKTTRFMPLRSEVEAEEKKVQRTVFQKEIVSVINLANLFSRVRQSYAKKFGFDKTTGAFRIYIGLKNPKECKFFKTFYKALYFFQEVLPDEDREEYMKAQFEIKEKEVFPAELYSSYSIKRYVKWCATVKGKVNPIQRVDPDIIADKDKEFMKLYQLNNNNIDPWTETKEDVPLPIYWFLHKRISLYGLMYDERFLKVADKYLTKGQMKEMNYFKTLREFEEQLYDY